MCMVPIMPFAVDAARGLVPVSARPGDAAAIEISRNRFHAHARAVRLNDLANDDSLNFNYSDTHAAVRAATIASATRFIIAPLCMALCNSKFPPGGLHASASICASENKACFDQMNIIRSPAHGTTLPD